jgi:hypothetical protein
LASARTRPPAAESATVLERPETMTCASAGPFELGGPP